MKTLGVIIGLIILFSKMAEKKNQPQKNKKNGKQSGSDFTTVNVKKKILHPEEKDMAQSVKNNVVQGHKKRIREDRRDEEEEEKNTKEHYTSSLFFEGSGDPKKELVKSIIYSEIIGSPKSLRK